MQGNSLDVVVICVPVQWIDLRVVSVETDSHTTLLSRCAARYEVPCTSSRGLAFFGWGTSRLATEVGPDEVQCSEDRRPS